MLGAFVNQSEKIKVEGFELIKVEERDGKQAINARELHQSWVASINLRIGFKSVLKSTDSLKIKTMRFLRKILKTQKVADQARSTPYL